MLTDSYFAKPRDVQKNVLIVAVKLKPFNTGFLHACAMGKINHSHILFSLDSIKMSILFICLLVSALPFHVF